MKARREVVIAAALLVHQTNQWISDELNKKNNNQYRKTLLNSFKAIIEKYKKQIKEYNALKLEERLPMHEYKITDKEGGYSCEREHRFSLIVNT